MLKMRHWIGSSIVCGLGFLIFFVWRIYISNDLFCEFLILFLFGFITIISLWISLDLNATDEKEEYARAAVLERTAPDQRRAFLIRRLRGDLTQAWNNRVTATRSGDLAAAAEHEAEIAKIELKLRDLGGELY